MAIRVLLLFLIWTSLICVAGAANYDDYIQPVHYLVYGMWWLLGLFCCYAIVAAILSQGSARYLWIGCSVFMSMGVFVGNSQVSISAAPPNSGLIVVNSIGQKLAPIILGEQESLFDSLSRFEEEPETFSLVKYENLISLIDLGVASVMSLIGAFVGAAFGLQQRNRR